MPILAVVELLAQVYFAVHAVKTGRPVFWIFIIIFFPGIGCLIYFFAEYLPEFQQNHRAQRMRTKNQKGTVSKRHLQQLEDQVEITPSVKNKKILAEAYVNNGMFDKAIALYMNCLEGIYQNDTSLLEGLSCAYFFKGDFSNAKIYLEKLLHLRENIKGDEFDLLLARTLEELNDFDNALKAYSKIINLFLGEEAKCRYALLLKKVGRNDEANEQFQEILKNTRLSPKYYVKNQKKWIQIAKKEVS